MMVFNYLVMVALVIQANWLQPATSQQMDCYLVDVIADFGTAYTNLDRANERASDWAVDSMDLMASEYLVMDVVYVNRVEMSY